MVIQMNDEITRQWMKERIGESNQQAAKNRNKYPIQEHATRAELGEFTDCTCTESCACKKHLACSGHWKLKKNVLFEDFMFGFLRMFVDRCDHLNLIAAVDAGDPSNLRSRVRDAYTVLSNLKGDEWKTLSAKSAYYPKTLFCDDWCDDYFKEKFESFRIKESVYFAKQFCILLPDICVPYDTKSRDKMTSHLQIPRNANYYEVLSEVRKKFLKGFEKHAIKLPEIRTFDSPGEAFSFPGKHFLFDPHLISLRQPAHNYGIGYLSEKGQISLILDKCYYIATELSTTEKIPGFTPRTFSRSP